MNAAEPVFILAPPCTFTWAVCAMIGQHPQMYALPELHLFTSETVADWIELSANESFEMDHGLVRAVAELYFGAQTEGALRRARGWIRRRSHFTTGLLLEAIADQLAPLIPVEKSPSIVYSEEAFQRLLSMFPGARFLHLVSHPRLYGESVMHALHELGDSQPLAPEHWLVQLASHPLPGVSSGTAADPQTGWYALHSAIAKFLSRVPAGQQKTIRGEDLVADANEGLHSVAAWLGVRTDNEAVTEMRHPERSPYSSIGPGTASFGSDIFLWKGPLLRPEWMVPKSLEGQLQWREDGAGFLLEVRSFARRLGYS